MLAASWITDDLGLPSRVRLPLPGIWNSGIYDAMPSIPHIAAALISISVHIIGHLSDSLLLNTMILFASVTLEPCKTSFSGTTMSCQKTAMIDLPLRTGSRFCPPQDGCLHVQVALFPCAYFAKCSRQKKPGCWHNCRSCECFMVLWLWRMVLLSGCSSALWLRYIPNLQDF